MDETKPGRRKVRLVAAVLVSLYLVQVAAITFEGLSDDVFPADLAVVLGNKVEVNGVPSPTLNGRLERALELYRSGAVPKLVVSGGFGSEGWDEADVMKRWLVERGVPADAIVADGQGQDTFRTAVFTRDFMRDHGMKSVIIVTQFFHIPRTRAILQRMGIERIGQAHARYHSIRDVTSLIREVPALHYYRLRPLP